jgi:hypothetical protein
MRSLALAVLWLLMIAAALAVLLFGAVIIFGEDGETRLGGALISVVALGLVFALRAGIRRLRRPADPPPAVAARPTLDPRDYGLPE